MTTESTASATPGTARSGGDVDESKFLTFCLGNEEYGVDILAVREIIGIIDVTPLPQMPEYVTGIINLRGRIIPVIDLRSRFGLESVARTAHTCIIVLDVGEGESEERYQMGIIVDTVREVLDIANESIEPAPDFGCAVNVDFVNGVGKVKDRVIILLDINKVLAVRELAAINEGAVLQNAGGELADELKKRAGNAAA